MFGITTFMYLLSAGYWVYSVLGVAERMQNYTKLALANGIEFSSGPDPVLKWSPLVNAIVFINVCISSLAYTTILLFIQVRAQRWDSRLEGLGDHLAKPQEIHVHPDYFLVLDCG
jgi:hypothetical protein